MKKLFYSVALMIACFSYENAQAQTNDTDLKDSSAIIFPDDPIASVLDSLSRLMIFDKPVAKTKNKFDFAPDYVPNYSDSIYSLRLKKLDADSPFDLIYNNAVRSYIELYAVRKREMVQRMLGMSELYFPMIEEILDRRKIPLELKYLAIVESALNPTARSKAGAVGLWQFMYGTGKMMGLKISSYVDERSDPYKATEAACDYIQFLYDMFGDWQMVLAAYNGGPGTISKAIRRSGGKNTYWEIRPYLPRETQGYVPAFIAVNYVMTHWEEQNLSPTAASISFADVDTVNIKQELSFQQISKVLGIPMDEIRYLNPSYKRSTIPFSPDKTYSLCLPTEKIGSFITNEASIYEYAKTDSLMQSLAVQEVAKTHTVRKGETISRVAARYGCTPEDIKAWNRLKSPKVRPGQRLTVYISSNKNMVATDAKPSKTISSDTTRVAKATTKTNVDTTNVSASADNKYKFVTVQKGDSLWSIAQQNGVTINQLKQWNKISNGTLMPGQKIKIMING